MSEKHTDETTSQDPSEVEHPDEQPTPTAEPSPEEDSSTDVQAPLDGAPSAEASPEDTADEPHSPGETDTENETDAEEPTAESEQDLISMLPQDDGEFQDSGDFDEASDHEPSDDEIAAPEDLGQNAHQVVTALLAHQKDLVLELKEVYERLDELHESEASLMQRRLAEIEQALGLDASGPSHQEQLDHALATAKESTAAELERLSSEHESKIAALNEQHGEQLVERDARISALGARLDAAQEAAQAAAERADEAHAQVQELAQEFNSSLITRTSSALGKVTRRLRG